MKEKGITLGLDMGTNSLGWAVVDNSTNDLVLYHGHPMWGVRMFSESSSAEDRRKKRLARRRYQRRRQRILLLREIFQKEICDKDPYFFYRMDQAFYVSDDRTDEGKGYLLENQKATTDFYNKYPTIWHLRYDLVTNKEKTDIRLVYLAIHHILKYRGNFLHEGAIELSAKPKDELNMFISCISSTYEGGFEREEDDDNANWEKYFAVEQINNDKFIDSLISIIDKYLDRSKKITEVVDPSKKRYELFADELIRLVGEPKNILSELLPDALFKGTVDLSRNRIYKEIYKNQIDLDKKDLKIIFNSDDFENKISTLSSKLKEISPLIEGLIYSKSIYNYYYFKDFMKGSSSLSEAFIKKYNENKKDLKSLKSYYDKYLSDKKNSMFRDNKVNNNFVNYVGHYSPNEKNPDGKSWSEGEIIKIEKKKSDYFDFLNTLKKDLNSSSLQNHPEAQKEADYFLKKIEDNTLLQRLNNASNSVIPMQFNKKELVEIINNQKEYYPDLFTDININHIEQIFSFKREYFIGPIDFDKNNKSKFSWVVQKETALNKKQKIYPWNFYDVVDKKETQKNFIQRMLNHCTYLKGENDYCIPSSSISYQAFVCLQYVNKLRDSNNNLISVDAKQQLFKDLFLSNKTVTAKEIKEWMYQHKLGNTASIPTCNCNMSTYISFKNLNKYKKYEFLRLEQIKEIDEIVKLMMIFSDKETRNDILKNDYHFDDEDIKQIKGFNYKNWGRLSDRFLNGIKIEYNDEESNEHREYNSLNNVLWFTNFNLNEILFNSKFNFHDEIEKYNENKYIDLKESDDDFLKNWMEKNVCVSPIWTRSFVQTYKLIKEVNELLKEEGKEISYYSVECTRENKSDKKGKETCSRYDRLLNIFKNKDFNKEARDQGVNVSTLIKSLQENKDSINNSDHFLLYFQQLGKDMYTLKPITDLDEIGTNKTYDIDHIYPQSILKDDSISNRVLTKSTINRDLKKNKFLSDPNCGLKLTKEAFSFYKFLFDNSLISRTKYNRLTEKEIHVDSLESFINRQKVATDQSTKAIIELLKFLETNKYCERNNEMSRDEARKEAEKHIIYSKAGIVSDFRKKYQIYKSRIANNYHHAHDAYLNAVLGKTLKEYYDDKKIYLFGDELKKRIQNDGEYTINPDNILSERVRESKDHHIIWGGIKEIDFIKNNIQNNFDIRETMYTYYGNTLIGQETVEGKKGQGKETIKSLTPNGNKMDLKKYGGYKKASYPYFYLIEKNNGEAMICPINSFYKDDSRIDRFIEENFFKKDKKNTDKGKPLFKKILKLKINTVILSPKDDNKHLRKMYITGSHHFDKDLNIKNGFDRNFKKEDMRTIHMITKFIKVYELNDCFENCNPRIEFGINENTNSYIQLKNGNDCFLIDEDIKHLYNSIFELWNKPMYNIATTRNLIEKISRNYDSWFKNRILSKERFINIIYILNEMLKYLKTNDSSTLKLKDNYLKDNKEKKDKGKDAGDLNLGINLYKGMKIVSYSITGFKTKVLYKVKN